MLKEVKGFIAGVLVCAAATGTGIGLFVRQQMMERNGGTIAIESEEGKGTLVTIQRLEGTKLYVKRELQSF